MTQSGPDSSRPNIVLIMTDQHRYDLTAAAGYPLDTMPFCDALAARGRRFSHGYTTAPACVPARTSVLTGRYPSAHRVRQNSTPRSALYSDDLLDVLAAAGYQTAFAGKPHMYRGEQDFDRWSGPYMHTGAPDESAEQKEFTQWLTDLDHGPATEPTPFPIESQYPYRIVSDSIAMIEERDTERPFFGWVSLPEPHNPYQVPEPYWSMFADRIPDRAVGPEGADSKGGMYRWLQQLVQQKRPGFDDDWRRYRATYCGMLRLIDDQLARLVAAIEDRLGPDTVIIVTSDHGDYVGEYGLQRKGAGMPEVLMRVPFFVTGPGIAPVADDRSMVSLADLLPTVAEAAGQPIPPGVQGRSLWPLLTGGVDRVPDLDSVYAESGYGGLRYPEDARPELHFPYQGTKFDELNTVTQSGTSRMLRRGEDKLIFHSDGTGELYRLADDPYELDDLWSDDRHRDLREAMITELLWWTLRVSDDLPVGNYTTLRPDHNWWR